jgi:site-specific recombinase XerD
LKEIVMLSEFFEAPSRIRAIRGGPSGALLEAFANYLFESGYATISARRHIRSAEHIIHWAVRRRLVVHDLDRSALEHFGSHLSRCRCGRYSRADHVNILTGARLFLEHLQGGSGHAIRVTKPTAPEPGLWKAFCAWMRAQRGTSDQTLYNYGIPIRELIRRLGGNPSKLDAHSLRQFVLHQSRTTGWAAAKKCTTALRMFLRFLIAEGRCPAALLGAIPVLPHWRLTSLPRYLPPDDVERLSASCDLSSPVGKRDRAILLLLARLGLRAGDIVQMRLQDIDWKGAWIQVSGKSRRQTRLPLSQEVGQAIVTYLQEGRPQVHNDALFVCSRAPYRPLASHCAVSVLVDRAIRRAGITRPSRGAAHLLRHSLATSMLQQGASLQDISVLLRHQSIETTQIYAKVDITGLRQIAQPWPEVPSC